MKTIPLCHLHFHTEYSLLDSSCKVGDAVKMAKELGQEYLAITDLGVLYGVIDFYKQAIKAGVKPVIGCEVYIARNELGSPAFPRVTTIAGQWVPGASLRNKADRNIKI